VGKDRCKETVRGNSGGGRSEKFGVSDWTLRRGEQDELSVGGGENALLAT